jgi:serine/threonine protein kinase
MGEGHFDRLQQLFLKARELPPDKRRAFLDSACAGDGGLLAEAEQLLAAYESTVDPPAPQPAKGAVAQIGPYRILELIGEGGMGTVYKAEQRAPIKRIVALKLIKLGFDTADVIARFQSERQALARMDHPHVARVLDAGADDRGRPYFVMEYFAGVPITRYADDNKLSVTDRLKLFLQVCDAIAHAHTKAIIHRDIKAGNVLACTLDGKPSVKVIDFGIAKALTGDRLTDLTLNTGRGQVIGTYESMSPEQADGSADIDTRADVYSLGVLLYELLTGAKPFDGAMLAKAADAEIRRIIREVEPPKPSTRLSSMGGDAGSKIALDRKAHRDALTKELRSELEWIPLMAMRKERDRRYANVADFSADISNYLGHRPLQAAPESRTYRIGKLARRNSGILAAAGLVLVALLLGVVGFAWQAHRVTIQRDKALGAEQSEHIQRLAAVAAQHAEEAARKAEDHEHQRFASINQFVQSSLYLSDPLFGGKQELTVSEAMADLVKQLDADVFKDQPEIEAGLRLVVSKVLEHNGHPSEALPPAERALDLFRQIHPKDHADIAASLGYVAKCLESLGRFSEALPKYEAALAMDQRLYKDDHLHVAWSLGRIASCLESLGRSAEALPKFEAALAMDLRLGKDSNEEIPKDLNNLALCLDSLGRSSEALPKFEAALEMDRRVYRGDHPNVATGLCSLALCLKTLGRCSEALLKLEIALKMYQRLYTGDHPLKALCIHNLASCLDSLGRSSEALPKYVAALAMEQRLYKGDHPHVALGLNGIAGCLELLGRPSEALPKYKAALEMNQRLFKSDHPEVALGMNNIASCLYSLGRISEALPEYEAALAMEQRLYNGDHPYVASCLNNIAACLQLLGRPSEALPKYKAALEMYQRLFKGDHANEANCLNNLGECLVSLGRSDEAASWFEAARAMQQRLGPDANQAVTRRAGTRPFNGPPGGAGRHPVLLPSVVFWFDYNFGPLAGPRQWKLADANHWQEIYPDGHFETFKIVGPSPDAQHPGTVARKQPDTGFEVLIPPIKEGAQLAWRFKESDSWSFLPAAHVAPATQPAQSPRDGAADPPVQGETDGANPSTQPAAGR